MTARRDSWLRRPLKASWVLFLLPAVLAISGCKKSEPAPKPEPTAKPAAVSIDAPAAQPADPAAAPAAATPPPPPPAAEASADANNDQSKSPEAELIEKVQYAYFAYCREHTAPPKDINVLVTEHYLLSIPALPSGRRFILDNKNLKVTVGN